VQKVILKNRNLSDKIHRCLRGIVHTSEVDFTMYVRNRNSIHRGARKSCELTSKGKTFPFPFFLNFYHSSATYIKIYGNLTKYLQRDETVIFCDEIVLFINVIVIVIFFIITDSDCSSLSSKKSM